MKVVSSPYRIGYGGAISICECGASCVDRGYVACDHCERKAYDCGYTPKIYNCKGYIPKVLDIK